MRLDPRQRTYLWLRIGAGAVLLVAGAVLPRGVPAALLFVAGGLVAVLACIAANANGPGERAAARVQNRAIARLQAPQGDWPPYPEQPDGQHVLAEHREA